MSLPIIGITGDITRAKFYANFWNKRSGINDAYIRAVERANGIPIILPVSNSDYVSSIVKKVDGFIFSGGCDISPFHYNEEPLSEIKEMNPERDVFELALLKEVLQQGKPILGICRGAQILNIALGGTLYQDTSYNKSFNLQHLQQSEPALPIHGIETKKGSFIHSIIGDKSYVNSIHHQILRDIGEGLEVTAWSSDSAVEAIEKKNEDFVIGLQWHPEIMSRNNEQMQNIFNELIKHSSKNL